MNGMARAYENEFTLRIVGQKKPEAALQKHSKDSFLNNLAVCESLINSELTVCEVGYEYID